MGAHRGNRLKPLVVIGTLARMGGAERQALYFVEHLAGLGKSPEVLTFGDGEALRPMLDALRVPVHAIDYHAAWPRARRANALARLILRLRSRVKPDAILPFGAPASKVTGLIWRHAAARYAWWNQQDEGRGLAGSSAERKILARMPSITSNSYVGRDFLAATYGIDAERIRVYNNGTPVPEGRDDRGDWRENLNAGNRPLVAMIANVTRFKDHNTLVAAWPKVKQHFASQRPPVLVLAGHLQETSLVSVIKTKAFDLGLSADDIRFLGPINDVGGLLRACELVVHSSLTEGCPNAVCEAMALGRAVVATDIPGCRQALGDSSMQLVAPQSPAELAHRIIEMLEQNDLRQQLGERNRQRIKSEFSIDGMNAFFTDLMETGLADAVGRR